MDQTDINALERMLDDYADWMHQGGSTTDWFPRKCVGAPDSRVQTVEDMEIEVDSQVMQAVDAAVDDLRQPYKHQIWIRCGLTADVWRYAHAESLYNEALVMLRCNLKKRICV